MQMTIHKQRRELPPLQTAGDVLAFKAGGVLIGVDVDTQVDFAEKEGSLYVSVSDSVRNNIRRLIQGLDYRIGSVDSHAFDAWEFLENGGPFPRHCVKGTGGWLKIPETQTGKIRFVPMSKGNLVIGESVEGGGNRNYGPAEFAAEVVDGNVTGIFEKEVYSLFSNPNAESMIEEVVKKIEEERKITRDKILFVVFGYCTGGYCVDSAALGLRERDYNTAIAGDASAPLDIDRNGQKQNGARVTRKTADQNGIYILDTSVILADR